MTWNPFANVSTTSVPSGNRTAPPRETPQNTASNDPAKLLETLNRLDQGQRSGDITPAQMQEQLLQIVPSFMNMAQQFLGNASSTNPQTAATGNNNATDTGNGEKKELTMAQRIRQVLGIGEYWDATTAARPLESESKYKVKAEAQIFGDYAEEDGESA